MIVYGERDGKGEVVKEPTHSIFTKNKLRKKENVTIRLSAKYFVKVEGSKHNQITAEMREEWLKGIPAVGSARVRKVNEEKES